MKQTWRLGLVDADTYRRAVDIENVSGSTLEKKPGLFEPAFGKEQLDWLSQDLAAAKGRPTIVVSHAPAVSAVELFTDRAKLTDEGRMVPYGRVTRDTSELLEVVKDAKISAFRSGHLHLVEDLRFNGFRFICSGSVSGHQWTGPRFGTPAGFGIVDCSTDGSLDYRYFDYGLDGAAPAG